MCSLGVVHLSSVLAWKDGSPRWSKMTFSFLTTLVVVYRVCSGIHGVHSNLQSFFATSSQNDDGFCEFLV